MNWIRAGEDSPSDFPIASRAYHALHEHFDFDLGGGAALSADIQRIERFKPRSDMIRTSDLASYLTEEFGATVLLQFAGNSTMPSRRPVPFVTSKIKRKRASAKEKTEEAAASKKKKADDAAAWNSVDQSIHTEFAMLAALMQAEGHSVVPAGYVPKRTEVEEEEHGFVSSVSQ